MIEPPPIDGTITRSKFDSRTLPPTFETVFGIECGIDEFDVTLHSNISFPPYQYSLSWVENTVLTYGVKTIKHHLAFDRQIHKLLAPMIPAILVKF